MLTVSSLFLCLDSWAGIYFCYKNSYPIVQLTPKWKQMNMEAFVLKTLKKIKKEAPRRFKDLRDICDELISMYSSTGLCW